MFYHKWVVVIIVFALLSGGCLAYTAQEAATPATTSNWSWNTYSGVSTWDVQVTEDESNCDPGQVWTDDKSVGITHSGITARMTSVGHGAATGTFVSGNVLRFPSRTVYDPPDQRKTTSRLDSYDLTFTPDCSLFTGRYDWTYNGLSGDSCKGSTYLEGHNVAQGCPAQNSTTSPTNASTTEQPVNCQAMYSSCIQSNCPGLQGTKTCYDSCQRQVEVQRGDVCVLFPQKMVTTGTGKAGDISGDVAVILPSGQGSVPLKNGDGIPLGSTVTTKNGKVMITFEDGSQVNLGPNSQYTYDKVGFRLQTGQMKNFALCSLDNLAPGSFACPTSFTPVASFTVRGGTS